MIEFQGGAPEMFHATTVLCVRKNDQVAMAGDGQVTMQHIVAKSDAVKIRKLPDVGMDGQGVLVGFAGSAADAFTLVEKFENHLGDSPENIKKAAVSLARLWRTDRMLRKLESLLAVADKSSSLLISGSGDVIEPDDGILGIGSGGSYATAAGRALLRHADMSAREIAENALQVAGELCIYTNTKIKVVEI